MPAHYSIDTQNHIVLTVFRGVVTLNDINEQTASLRDDPAFDPSFSELVDFSGVSEVQMDYAAFRSWRAIDPFSTRSKRAFVIGSQNSVYGAARMYQIMRSDEVRVEIVKTIGEASFSRSDRECAPSFCGIRFARYPSGLHRHPVRVLLPAFGEARQTRSGVPRRIHPYGVLSCNGFGGPS